MDNNRKMTRREALKVMGTTALGFVLASTGASNLASCTGQKAKRIIFYFTGTGNCLHIARELSTDDTELLSIPQMMKQGRFSFEADEIGVVYPIYGHMPPYMVRQFIQKAQLKADYKFAVLTFGARKCDAVEIWDGISRKAGNAFDYITTLIMVDNWLPNFDMNEQMKIDKKIPENLQRITADLKQQRRWHEPVTEEERQQHQGFMNYTGLDPEVGFLKKSEKYFVVADSCIHCGICTYVCPRGNYKQTSRGVKAQGDCEFCFACIQNCPQKAIQFAKVEDDPLLSRGEVNPNARYRNEHISLVDLKRANNQF
ncbi:MAG: EFR1 family ferrodoxin [Bacteroides sp.]|nr:EFR1 family ferrodoxin [Bacteroides sp.]